MAWTSKNSGKPMHINHFFRDKHHETNHGETQMRYHHGEIIQIYPDFNQTCWNLGQLSPNLIVETSVKNGCSKISPPQPQPALAVPRPAHQADCHSWSSTPSVSFLAPPVDTALEAALFAVIKRDKCWKIWVSLKSLSGKRNIVCFFFHWNSWSIIINHHKSS